LAQAFANRSNLFHAQTVLSTCIGCREAKQKFTCHILTLAWQVTDRVNALVQ